MIDRRELEDLSRSIAGYLTERFGGTVGFTVFVFEYAEKKTIAYVSTAARETMIEAVEEWLARVKTGLMTDPLGPRAEG